MILKTHNFEKENRDQKSKNYANKLRIKAIWKQVGDGNEFNSCYRTTKTINSKEFYYLYSNCHHSKHYKGRYSQNRYSKCFSCSIATVEFHSISNFHMYIFDPYNKLIMCIMSKPIITNLDIKTVDF